jgi:NAD(P)-dependent dehydrogenase (short-subunit alcohol dehydrogenase family)
MLQPRHKRGHERFERHPVSLLIHSLSRRMTSPTLDSPTVLITGARGGIGQALMAQLAPLGWRMAGVTRQASALTHAHGALVIEADVTQPEGVAQAMQACTSHWGVPPMHLVHLVGSTQIAPLHRTTTQQLREVLRVNLESALLVLSAWVDARRAAAVDGRSSGGAVLASSVVAQIGVANHEAIAAAKGGVEALVRSAAATYAPLGLRINAVAPGMTDTPMTAGMLKAAAMREAAGKQYPLGGVQSAEDVAGVVAWLLSAHAARVTGHIVPVDGGFTHVRPLVK